MLFRFICVEQHSFRWNEVEAECVLRGWDCGRVIDFAFLDKIVSLARGFPFVNAN